MYVVVTCSDLEADYFCRYIISRLTNLANIAKCYVATRPVVNKSPVSGTLASYTQK